MKVVVAMIGLAVPALECDRRNTFKRPSSHLTMLHDLATSVHQKGQRPRHLRASS